MRSSIRQGTVYTRVLEDFGGLDVAHPPSGVAPNRFTRMENLWRDYAGGEGSLLETFPGYRELTALPGTVHGIYRVQLGKTPYLLIHAGQGLYAAPFADTDGAEPTSFTPVTGSEGVLADAASTAFTFSDALYLLDGQGYYAIRAEEGVPTLASVTDTYVPVTYVDGEVYEQRNMLSDRARVRYHVHSPTAFSYGTPQLTYRILSESEGTCEVSGVSEGFKGDTLYIPATVTIGARTCRVTQIARMAFPMKYHLKRLYISEGVEAIGDYAFCACTALEEAMLPDGLRTIGVCAFKDCSFTNLVLGAGVVSIGRSAFACARINALTLHGEQTGYWEGVTIGEGNELLQSVPTTYAYQYPIRFCAFSLYEPVTELLTISIGENRFDATEERCFTVCADGVLTGVVIRSRSGEDMTGQEVELEVRLAPSIFRISSLQPDFSAANPAYAGSAAAAILGSRINCLYDGRVFFTGNPALPNTVFYAARDRWGAINPAYVGVLNYFNAGVGQSPISALLPTASHLAVLKGGEGTEGSVVLYAGRDTGEDLLPRIYAAEQTLSAEACLGGAENFGGDPVYLSRSGVVSVGSESLNATRIVWHRSTLIDAALAEKAGQVPLSTVYGSYYILLYPNGEAYLADGRRPTRTALGSEYEWYRLAGIVGYTDDVPVFRYASGYEAGELPQITLEGRQVTLSLHPLAGQLPLGATEESYPTIYPAVRTVTGEEGHSFSYVVETREGERIPYLVTRTGERAGGTPAAPSALAACGGKLFFGCTNGQVFTVNTDKRRVGGGLPTELYAFGGHAFTAGFETGMDLCGVPNYTKRTLRRTAVAEIRTGGAVMLDVRVHHGAYRTTTTGAITAGSGISFDTLRFDTISFGAGGLSTLVLHEGNRKWVGKQYRMYTHAFAAPFALHRIAYSWQVAGKIKNQ